MTRRDVAVLTGWALLVLALSPLILIGALGYVLLYPLRWL